MCITIEPAANRRSLTVEVGSTFVMEDAQQLGAAIADAAPGTEVDIDFRQVRECHGPALARLAEAMRSGHAHVALRGMSDHHLKLLGYLGAPSDALGSATPARP
jgi:hypothetical protein